MVKDLVQVAVDNYNGVVVGEYSASEANEVLRKAMIELNGGSATFDFRAVRDGKCNGLFALVEKILTKTVLEGLPENNPLMRFVEDMHVKHGDQISFTIEGTGNFVVSEIAEGTQALRRQRMFGGEDITIKTKVFGVQIYEELARVLAGRVDFNKFIDQVAATFMKQITEDMYKAVVGGFNGLAAPHVDGGVFDEDKLAMLIEQVETDTGKTAIILGSKQAVRKIKGITAADANSAKEDLYAMGYYGRFGENPIIVMKNGRKAGTASQFVLDNDLYIIASDDKFVKFVTEGDALVIPGNPLDNQDLSQEFTTIQKYGIKAVMCEANGLYKLA